MYVVMLGDGLYYSHWLAFTACPQHAHIFSRLREASVVRRQLRRRTLKGRVRIVKLGGDTRLWLVDVESAQ